MRYVNGLPTFGGAPFEVRLPVTKPQPSIVETAAATAVGSAISLDMEMYNALQETEPRVWAKLPKPPVVDKPLLGSRAWSEITDSYDSTPYFAPPDVMAKWTPQR